ncbi:MAG: hypothetical protein FWE62_00775, partial [Firmicutes bacterium]|nr:hypothetical protein [Bacillota bacterium]
MAIKSAERKPPDYSASAKKLVMYAHDSPTDGRYTVLGSSEELFSEDYRTVARYKEYRECGFDVLILLGNDSFNHDYGVHDPAVPLGGANWVSDFDNRKYFKMKFEDSPLKMNLETAQAAGLKLIVFDVIIHNLSIVEGGLIGAGKRFANEAELDAYVLDLISPYKDHPAFYGINLRDEPFYPQLLSYGQVYNALKRVAPGIYIPLSILNLVIVPEAQEFYRGIYAGPHKDKYPDARAAYEFYVDTFLTQCDDFGLAYYPSGKNSKTGAKILSNVGLANLQLISRKTAEKSGHFLTIVQTFANNSFAAVVNEAMIRHNTNSALAFGAHNVVYFTYWMFPFKDREGFIQGIMDDFGNKMLYDEVQRINRELQATA